MSRIRTIKPEFFKHEELFDAERDSGLPLRLAFISLWTVADRDGRFKWRPRALKVDCLPYDECDFSRVLDVLATRGFVVRYECGGDVFGYIPSFSKHQFINNKEQSSQIPPPSGINELTRETRVDDAYSTPLEPVQRGREGGMGKEEEGKNTSNESYVAARGEARDQFWAAYPNKVGRPSADKALDEVLSLGVAMETVLDGVRRYVASKPSDRLWLSPAKFLSDARYLDEPAEVRGPQIGFSPSEAVASVPTGKVLVMPGTAQGIAWDQDYRAKGKPGLPISDKTGGWYVDSEYPPGFAPPSRGPAYARGAA